MTDALHVKLRPLEREDLRFVHQLDNNASVMRYWFEEPYEAFVELSDLYDKHIHDQSERRFVIECNGDKAGLVELVEINHVHRRAEFQIIISPDFQGKGLATRAARLAMDYGFTVLNLYKLYLIVDKENEKAIHIYRKLGFMVEGELIHEFFINGRVPQHHPHVPVPAPISGRAQNARAVPAEADGSVIIDTVFNGVLAGQRRLDAFIDHLQLTAQRIVVIVVVAGLTHRAQRAIVEGADGGIVQFLTRIL
ncbi:Spermidine N1-acetyltransferase [Klebsiella pneumoniae]|uniref:Spermidine N(1)-acetyltransferase n=7 Tax=Gammaproteobacteria TaxID=1236 RepID=A0A2X1QGM4_KLEPN|nr:Spermidine N1-acetyltransferase [Klebsiella pneumoniae]